MTKRAAVYCRISRDAEQEGLGVARQEEDCRALARRRGFEVVGLYVDNDISASRFGKKERPRFKAMMEAVAARQVDVVLAYDDSRITRRWNEKLGFLDAVIDAEAQVVTVASGEDDLTKADGLMMARIRATVSANASDKTSERQRRANLQRAQRGAPGQGGRPFGWGDDKRTLHPKEARLLRKGIQDVIAGVATREVARRWNAAGVTTTRGSDWDHNNVRQMLRQPRLAGYRVHQRAEKRRQAGKAGRPLAWRELVVRDATGQMVTGEWTAMVDVETFEQLQAALDGRAPGARRGSQRYLLSGVARCGVCGSVMYGSRTPRGHVYSCQPERRGDHRSKSRNAGHTNTVVGGPTDEFVTLLLERRLGQVDLSGVPVSAPEWPGDARLRAIPGLIADLMAAFESETLSAPLVFPRVQALETEQHALEQERPRALPRPGVATPEQFPRMDLDRRRAVVETLVDHIVVLKAERRGAPWTPDRLTVVWAG